MNELEFDKALEKFLDDDRCEKVSETVFELVRAAYTAGWKDALGSDIGQIMKIDKR